MKSVVDQLNKYIFNYDKNYNINVLTLFYRYLDFVVLQYYIQTLI